MQSSLKGVRAQNCISLFEAMEQGCFETYAVTCAVFLCISQCVSQNEGCLSARWYWAGGSKKMDPI